MLELQDYMHSAHNASRLQGWYNGNHELFLGVWLKILKHNNGKFPLACELGDNGLGKPDRGRSACKYVGSKCQKPVLGCKSELSYSHRPDECNWGAILSNTESMWRSSCHSNTLEAPVQHDIVLPASPARAFA